MEAISFRDLVRRAQAGDRRAMDLLLEEFEPVLEKAARDYVDPAQAGESASDLVQEAKLRAWQRLEQFQGSRDEAQARAMFGAWLGQIARHVGSNAREARQAQKRHAPHAAFVRIGVGGSSTRAVVDPAGSDPTPSAGARMDERAALIQSALARLPCTESREILCLCFFEGLTLRETSERLKLSYGQVRDRYHSAMRIMERELQRYL